jgi:hypothetical protein
MLSFKSIELGLAVWLSGRVLVMGETLGSIISTKK